MNANPGVNVELLNDNHKTKKKMKKTISIAFVAFALLSFTSCQKENLVSGNQEPALRTITATFESNGTKTTLDDNVTPLWSVGDEILILNASGCEPITLTTNNIKNSGRTITFTTTFSGDLYAVYPASATTMTSCDGDIEFTIPAIQDGTFASANICVAKNDNDNKLVFRNATAVLEFSQTATDTKVLSIRVEAANAIVGPMSVSFNADGTLDTPTTSSLSGKLINAKSTEAKDKYYVAVAPVTTGKIEFEYQKAVEVATVTTDAGKTLAVNKIYACSMDEKEYNIKTGTINGHDYVQVGSVRWATMNIGATTVAGSHTTCFGHYFAWGETTGHSVKSDIVISSSVTNAFEGDYSFTNVPTLDPANPKVLPLSYDAAYTQWGTNWRMPTKDEFKALYEACGRTGTNCKPSSGGSESTTARGIYWCQNYNSVKGLLFIVEDNAAHLFFPTAGYGNDTSLTNAGSRGYYRSSSLYSGNTGRAYNLYFYIDSVSPQYDHYRYYGYSVRPVSD